MTDDEAEHLRQLSTDDIDELILAVLHRVKVKATSHTFHTGPDACIVAAVDEVIKDLNLSHLLGGDL